MPSKLPFELPPGVDPIQFLKDLTEAGGEFAKQFDREDPNFHAGLTTPVPTGGQRVPESMDAPEAANWRALPECAIAIENSYGAEYDACMASYERLGMTKKAIGVLNKPVEMALKVRWQYKDCEGDDTTAMKSRLAGAENARDGALAAATVQILGMDKEHVSKRTLDCVKEVVERGKFHFEDRETFGEYMTVLQRCNQTIFADQKILLAKIKELKKRSQQPTPTDAAKPEEATAHVETETAPAPAAASAA